MNGAGGNCGGAKVPPRMRGCVACSSAIRRRERGGSGESPRLTVRPRGCVRWDMRRWCSPRRGPSRPPIRHAMQCVTGRRLCSLAAATGLCTRCFRAWLPMMEIRVRPWALFRWGARTLWRGICAFRSMRNRPSKCKSAERGSRSLPAGWKLEGRCGTLP